MPEAARAVREQTAAEVKAGHPIRLGGGPPAGGAQRAAISRVADSTATRTAWPTAPETAAVTGSLRTSESPTFREIKSNQPARQLILGVRPQSDGAAKRWGRNAARHLEDDFSGVCIGSSGTPFAHIIYVRIADQCHVALMPAAENPKSAATYFELLNHDNEKLKVSRTQFKHEKECWDMNPEPVTAGSEAGEESRSEPRPSTAGRLF